MTIKTLSTQDKELLKEVKKFKKTLPAIAHTNLMRKFKLTDDKAKEMMRYV
jgi:hypothetical protein